MVAAIAAVGVVDTLLEAEAAAPLPAAAGVIPLQEITVGITKKLRLTADQEKRNELI
jgi:hypothetical protein